MKETVTQLRSQNKINFTHNRQKLLKILPRIASKIGTTLKVKNSLPGSKFFTLREAPVLKIDKLFPFKSSPTGKETI